MNRKMWSAEERAEYEAMMTELCTEATGTGERVQLYRDLLADAAQAQRFWATDATDDAMQTGCREHVTGWLKSHRVVVQIADRSVSKPRTIGVKRKADDGVKYDAQVMFDVIDWDELTAKRGAYLTTMRAYTDDVAVMDRLLALRELAPGAANPGEALTRLGVSLDDYLGAAA